MSDYELERMDPAAYADAVDRERQDPLRPYHLKVEQLEAELARLREEKEAAEAVAWDWESGEAFYRLKRQRDALLAALRLITASPIIPRQVKNVARAAISEVEGKKVP